MRRLFLAATAALALLAAFVLEFDPETPQWDVDAIWLAALAIWAGAVWTLRERGDGWRIAHPWALSIAVLLFCAAWLPFYGNWRWAFTADSLGWFEIPYGARMYGIPINVLSVRGVDDNFTYLHSLASNSLMLLIEPTLFWHRVGKMLVSAAGLAAIYLVFTVTISHCWGMAIAAAVATNYVWLWFSYVSLGHVDSFVFAFLSLTLAALIWRRPANRVLWMACGIVGGLSAFFTQTAWAEVGVVGIALTIAALRLRRLDLLAIYALSLFLAAAPFLLQWRAVAAMIERTGGPSPEASYTLRIFAEILAIPVTSYIYDLGVHEGFLRLPLSWLYVAGVVVAATGAHPRWRRELGIPGVAPLLLGLLVFDAALLALNNNLYSNPSTKRAYHLIAYQVFLALLPLIALQRRGRVVGWAPWHVWLPTVLVLCASAATNARTVIFPPPAMYGSTVLDGLIELRQGYPDRMVVLFTSRGSEVTYSVLSPDSTVAREYHLADTVVIESRFAAAALAAARDAAAVICYEPEFDKDAFAAMVTPTGALLSRLPLRNTWDLYCYE
jgi:hypothetical protein